MKIKLENIKSKSNLNSKSNSELNFKSSSELNLKNSSKLNLFSVIKKVGILFVATLFFVNCGKTTGSSEENKNINPSEGLKKITVVLDWTPNTNHTGLYVAKDKGYYKEQGLDVEIIQPAQDTSVDIVAQNSAQFGVSYQESVTIARAAKNPLPVIAIAAVIQHNTSGFAAPVSKGIKSPKDFQNKVYGSYGSKLEEGILKNLVEKDGGDFSKIKMINNDATDFFAATEKDIDFAWIYEGWDVVQAKLLNKPINYISIISVNPELDWYTPVIITSEKYAKENPDTVKKFMKATAKGYQDCIDSPEESAKYLIANAPGINEKLVIESQKYLATKYIDDAEYFGEMKEKVWVNFTKFLYENGVIEREIDVKKAYTNEFIKF